MARYIFITGGVVSSLGKGLASAALGALLQARGYAVRLRKLDPYLNVDPGTMSPMQHGEVFVTDDGAETDLDLGHYERFTDVSATRADNVTTGRIYQTIITQERRGDYLGGTVQVVPHVTDAIKAFVLSDPGAVDFVLCEIGGTVGDIEGLPFFEAMRQLRLELGAARVLALHVTLLPYVRAAGEMKTKPSQHSVKELLSIGIQPDILLCRCEHPIPDDSRRKLALFCNVEEKDVIQALDAESIYQVPLAYHDEGLDDRVLAHFAMDAAPAPDLARWGDIVERQTRPDGAVRIAVVGKYDGYPDAYKSLFEALTHGGIANRVAVEVVWVASDALEGPPERAAAALDGVDAVLVPGGFGARGAEGKIAASRFARERRIPFFGICFGMQLAVVEIARALAGLDGAGSTEFREECGDPRHPVVGLMTEWMDGEDRVTRRAGGDLGGTMRLGAYPAVLKPRSRAAEIYQATQISERHRHRYEINTRYRLALEAAGLVFSGMSPDDVLPEIVELESHPWFVGVQFHPELKSRPFNPHPLFASFVAAAMEQSRLV